MEFQDTQEVEFQDILDIVAFQDTQEIVGNLDIQEVEYLVIVE